MVSRGNTQSMHEGIVTREYLTIDEMMIWYKGSYCLVC